MLLQWAKTTPTVQHWTELVAKRWLQHSYVHVPCVTRKPDLPLSHTVYALFVLETAGLLCCQAQFLFPQLWIHSTSQTQIHVLKMHSSLLRIFSFCQFKPLKLLFQITMFTCKHLETGVLSIKSMWWVGIKHGWGSNQFFS